MKSSSDVRPDIIQDLGNGSFFYNYNITEEKVESEETGEKTVYHFDTVQLWQKPTYESLTKAVIRNEIDESGEFSLINDFYAAQLGVDTDAEHAAKAISEYKDYLRHTAAIKAQVKADLSLAGYIN